MLGLGGADTISAMNGIATLTALTIDGGDGRRHPRRRRRRRHAHRRPRQRPRRRQPRRRPRAPRRHGDDRFQWDPGDGSDTVEGQAGNDRLDFNGSNAGEKIELSANGGRTRLTRNIAAITMDFDGIERVARPRARRHRHGHRQRPRRHRHQDRRRRPERVRRRRRRRGRHRDRTRHRGPRPRQPHLPGRLA